MNKKLLALVVSATLASPFAMAQDAPSYTFGEVGYTTWDIDGADADGFTLDGSVALGENFFIVGNWGSVSGDGDGDIDMSGIGFGAKMDNDNGGSFYASYNFGSWDLGAFDLDVDTLRLGYRHMTTDKLELNGSFTSNDMEGDSETGFQLGLAYSATDTFQITAEFETIDELDMISFGARFNF
jgi:hypothetical protein